MRSLRLDDFPHGDKNLYKKDRYRTNVAAMLNILNRHEMHYFLGVSPQLLNPGDIEFLNENVKNNGKVVMHGFDHHWSYPDWSRITDTWPSGGEFSDLSNVQISDEYDRCNDILSKVEKYDRHIFIPPFNCFNQIALDVLHSKGITDIHTCDKEFDSFNQMRMNYHGMMVHVSQLYATYDYALNVRQICHLNKSQITLHWIYEALKPCWLEDIDKLCVVLTKENSNEMANSSK